MQTKTEFLIWDKIVNSAKQRFNYQEYLPYFSDPKIYDKLILHIIVGFASGESHNTISTNLHNELTHIGIHVYEQVVDEIISDKHSLFSAEIYAAYLTFSMLEDGDSEIEILGYVTDLIEKPQIYK